MCGFISVTVLRKSGRLERITLATAKIAAIAGNLVDDAEVPAPARASIVFSHQPHDQRAMFVLETHEELDLLLGTVKAKVLNA